MDLALRVTDVERVYREYNICKREIERIVNKLKAEENLAKAKEYASSTQQAVYASDLKNNPYLNEINVAVSRTIYESILNDKTDYMVVNESMITKDNYLVINEVLGDRLTGRSIRKDIVDYHKVANTLTSTSRYIVRW